MKVSLKLSLVRADRYHDKITDTVSFIVKTDHGQLLRHHVNQLQLHDHDLSLPKT